MPRGKDWLWIIVGALLVMFVLPLLSSKLGKKSNG